VKKKFFWLFSCLLICDAWLLASVSPVETHNDESESSIEEQVPLKKHCIAGPSALTLVEGGFENTSIAARCSSPEITPESLVAAPPSASVQPSISAEGDGCTVQEPLTTTRRSIAVQTDDDELLQPYLVKRWFVNCQQAFISALDCDGSGRKEVCRLVAYNIAGDDPICAVVPEDKKAYIDQVAKELVWGVIQQKGGTCKMYDAAGALVERAIKPRPGQSIKDFLILHDTFLMVQCFDRCIRLLTVNQETEEIEVVSGLTIPSPPLKTDTLLGLCKAAIAKVITQLPDEDIKEVSGEKEPGAAEV